MATVSINCPSCNSKNSVITAMLESEVACRQCNHPLLDGLVWELSPHNFKSLTGTKTPVIVFMSGPNCKICQSFKAIFSSSCKRYKNQVRFAHAYLPQHQALVNKYKIRGVPTLAIFRQGKLQAMVDGGMRKKELAQFINKTLC